MTGSKHVAIIGGGISGLACANKLLELAKENNQAIKITLLEASDRLGGVIATDYLENFILEQGPDSFLTKQKPWALDLCRRLGLASQVISTNDKHRKTYIVKNKKLYPLPDGFVMLAPTKFWPFIFSPVLSYKGKLRMALDLVLPAKKSSVPDDSVQDESLANFVRRRFGREVLEQIAQPMIGGIYTANPETLSLDSTMPRFMELERKYGSVIKGLALEGQASGHISPGADSGSHNAGSSSHNAGSASPKANLDSRSTASTSGARYSMFASLKGGLTTLTATLKDRLSDQEIVFNSPVTAIKKLPGAHNWQLSLPDREIESDALVVAVPANKAAQLFEEFDKELASNLNSIPCASSIVLTFVFAKKDIPKQIDGFGFVVPDKEGLSIIAASFSSVKFAGRAPDGQIIIRVFLGGACQENIYNLNDEEIIARAKDDLKTLLAIQAEPFITKLYRFKEAMPQYLLGHKAKIKKIFDSIDNHQNLALAGNAYQGVGIPDCIHSGEMAAQKIFQVLYRAYTD